MVKLLTYPLISIREEKNGVKQTLDFNDNTELCFFDNTHLLLDSTKKYMIIIIK